MILMNPDQKKRFQDLELKGTDRTEEEQEEYERLRGMNQPQGAEPAGPDKEPEPA